MQILFILFLFLLGCSNTELPAPYSEVADVLPFDDQGWYDNRRAMKKVLREKNIKTVVEVGCWLGKSTRHIAQMIPNDGKVYAVDHWLGSSEHQQNSKLPQLYQQFLSNIIHAKLTHKVIPIRMASVDAEKFLKDLRPDLIYIDASHEMEAVYQDLVIWYPHVKGTGILCGDDFAWPGVREAVEKFAAENHMHIESKGSFWLLAETKL